MQFFPTVFNVPVVRKAEELLTYLQFFPWPWVRTMYTSTSVSNQLNCRKFENGLYWLMMYWQFPNLEVKWMDFQTKLEKSRVKDSFDQFCWHFLLTWILKLLFFWRENSNSTFLRENSKFNFFSISSCDLNSKINKILFLARKFKWFFSLIILANLFSSLFSHYVKRREESKVQDAGNKFLSTATLLCCVGYLSDNAWTCSCEKYSSQTETQKWHNEDVVYVISKRSTIHLNWNGDIFCDIFSWQKSVKKGRKCFFDQLIFSKKFNFGKDFHWSEF